MIQLMRNGLMQLYNHSSDPHAGLLMQRGLIKWEKDEKPKKAELIGKITAVQTRELYYLAFKRWLSVTYNDGDHSNDGKNNDKESSKAHFANVSASIDGRLYAGLPLGGTLETGVSTQHSYGMPMIAGSSVKGAVRSYVERLFALRDDNGNFVLKEDKVKKDGKVKVVQRLQIDPDRQPILDTLFGTDNDDNGSTADGENNSQDAGYIIWHDAWWIPPVGADGVFLSDETAKPFVAEVVTVHQQEYYSSYPDQALDMERPIPNQQIAIQGDFYFTLEGEPAWVTYAKTLLEGTLTEMGLGAKGSSGYGYFSLGSKLLDTHIEFAQAKQLQQQETQQKAKLTKNASTLKLELVDAIFKNQWQKDKDNFSRMVVEWVDKLIQNPEPDCVEEFYNIAYRHYATQMKNPDHKRVKENQRKWIKKLLALRSS